MKFLLDTNVVLDLLMRREPFVGKAIQLVKISSERNFVLCVTASSLTDIAYIIGREKDKSTTREIVGDLLENFGILSVGERTVRDAFESPIQDFEDAVQEATAVEGFAEGIITRNQKDFKQSRIRVYTPSQFVDEFTTKS